MKRIYLALLLSGLLVVAPALCGCGGQGAGSSGQAAQTEEESQAPLLDGIWVQRDREYGDEEKAAQMVSNAAESGYVAISMRDDWATIYGEGVEKTGLDDEGELDLAA